MNFISLQIPLRTIRKTSYKRLFSTSSLPSDFLKAVTSKIPNITINENKYDLESHGRGEGHQPTAPPAAILTPKTTDEVSKIMSLCNKFEVPVIAYGAGTSVEGHISALHSGSISLDMKEFNQIHLPNDGILDDAFVEVGAGVTRLELNEGLR